MAKEFWSIPEVAAFLGIGRTRTYQLVRDGVIPSLRVGRKLIRIPVADLRGWANDQIRKQTRHRCSRRTAELRSESDQTET